METMAISPEREERRRRQKELADSLKASGAMDEIFAKIDAGEPLTGQHGLLGGMLKAALERGLDAELGGNSARRRSGKAGLRNARKDGGRRARVDCALRRVDAVPFRVQPRPHGDLEAVRAIRRRVLVAGADGSAGCERGLRA